MNLAVNARDAMPHGGKLTIETANVELDEAYADGHPGVRPGSYVMLAVTDTGCGMDGETLSKIFEPFFTGKERGKGTGLGLATVYGIVKQSGGEIRVYSEPGHGATFKIYLPPAPAEPQQPESRAETPERQGGGEHILVVEDEASLRSLFQKILSSLGYRVSAAAHGGEALLLVEEQGLKPDLVITDVVMPGMSGPALVERLRRTYRNLRVLYMSGYPDNAIVHDGVLDPSTPYIQKPFNTRDMAAKVIEVLRGGRATERSRKSILMIDDDAQFRGLVHHFCRKGGHDFMGVDSSSAALECLGQRGVDVLLVDLNIPGTDGRRVLEEIRAAGHTMPAIVLTGDMYAVDLDALRPLGAVRALEKSSRAEPLLQVIEEAGTLDARP
jgi:CheY-like chemotaxis protein